MADAEALARFVAALPDGQRHKGTFWALNVAVDDGLSDAQIAPITQAAERNGLDRDYLERTIKEIRAD